MKRNLICFLFAVTSLGATTFTDSNFVAANYNAPATYNNGGDSSTVSFTTPTLTWTGTFSTFNPTPNAGFSIIHPGWSYDPGVLGPVLGITSSATFAVNNSDGAAESDYRVFVSQGGNLYRALVDGPVFTNGSTNTVSSGLLNAANFTQIGSNGLIVGGNPNLALPFLLGFGVQFQTFSPTTLSTTFSNVTIDVLNASSVPEPGTMVGGMAVLLLIFADRRRA